MLEPAFADAVRHGCLSADGDAFHLTELGEQEVAKYVAAMRAWLSEELADWGADDAQLGAALGDLATRFVEQSPQLTASPAGVLTTTRAP